MNKISLFIRKITVPHIFAALLLLLMYLFHPSYFGGIGHLLYGFAFLTVLPLLAYPLQKYIPHFKDKGRDGQRSLAMIFSSVGYLLCTLAAFIFKAPTEIKIVYLEYFVCGIFILLFNKLIKLKASGHACGIVGPVLLLAYFKMYIPAIIGALLTIPVYVSSIRTKRHTAAQLIVGSVIPIVALVLVHFIMR